MNKRLDLKFSRDMPLSSVEIVDRNFRQIKRVMMGPGEERNVEVPTEPLFVNIHTQSGKTYTISKDEIDETLEIDLKLLGLQGEVKAAMRPARDRVAKKIVLDVSDGTIRRPMARKKSFIEPVALEMSVAGYSPSAIASTSSTLDMGWSVGSPPRDGVINMGGAPIYDLRLPSNLDQLKTKIKSSGLKLKIMVELKSRSPYADGVLSFLQRGDLHSASSMSEWANNCEDLLRYKGGDPYAAAVGAYLLLRLGRYDLMHDWSRNLANRFEFLPDGCIIWAYQQIQQRTGSEEEILSYIDTGMERGLPTYTEGIQLLTSMLPLFDSQKVGKHYETLRAAGAVQWNSPITAFRSTKSKDSKYHKSSLEVTFGATRDSI